MAGISQHCKTGDVVAFGESVGVASKALCGLTEAAGQVRSRHGANSSPLVSAFCFSAPFLRVPLEVLQTSTLELYNNILASTQHSGPLVLKRAHSDRSFASLAYLPSESSPMNTICMYLLYYTSSEKINISWRTQIAGNNVFFF